MLTEAVLDSTELTNLMAGLSRVRPVFHSEADFQHALAGSIHDDWPQHHVRLETRPTKGTHLDMLVVDPTAGLSLAIELKYLTAAWQGVEGGEEFDLLNQGAQDIRAYDCVKDIGRVERYVAEHPGAAGLVLVLTNDPNYWSPRLHGRVTNAHEFRIHQGALITGTRSWGPHTGAGTLKHRESPITLMGTYTCQWRDYSRLPGARGNFRYLLLPMSHHGSNHDV